MTTFQTIRENAEEYAKKFKDEDINTAFQSGALNILNDFVMQLNDIINEEKENLTESYFGDYRKGYIEALERIQKTILDAISQICMDVSIHLVNERRQNRNREK